MFIQQKIKKTILENAILFFIYKKTILKIKRHRLEKSKAFLNKKGKMSFFSIETILNKKEIALSPKTIQDIIDCNLLYGFSVDEYVSFHLYEKDHWQRLSWLSDSYMDYLNILCIGKNWKDVYDELRDKNKFYELAKDFFNRDVLKISHQTTSDEIRYFVDKHKSFIAKPLRGTMGGNTHIVNASDFCNLNCLIKHYVGDDFSEWIFEELIEQVPELSLWNPTSVNTIRIPSFRKESSFVVFKPFIRTGRKGMVVDNGGQGGIFASLDAEKGFICTNGANENGEIFEKHPDSGITFMGWQVPLWQELIKLSEKIHKSLPWHHKYVAFDFALTSKGWVLVEGNWGQVVCQQMSLNTGLRKGYEKLMLG
jgi:hypothetical protein